MELKYHIHIEYGEKTHARWNYEKEVILKEYLIPFINGQVILLRRAEGPTLVNMKSVTSIVVYRTNHEIHPDEHSLVPRELGETSFSRHACTDELLKEAKGKTVNSAVKSLLEKAFAIPEDKVFVIMKFGDNSMNSAYNGVVKPIIKSHDLKCVRIDEIQNSGMITNQILEEIATSRFIISDLTGSRPNCYYESGFSHAIGKEIIFTIKHDEDIHFDLSGYRFIQWETEDDLRTELTKRIKSLLKSQD